MGKKVIDIKVDEKAPVVEKVQSYAEIAAAYKREQPEKYEKRKAEIEAKLAKSK